MPQFFPEANPLAIIPQATLRWRRAGQSAAVRRRAAVPVLRLQHALQHLGQHDEGEGRPYDEDRSLRRAHDAARGADVELQRQLQLRHRQPRTRCNTNIGFANALLGAIIRIRRIRRPSVGAWPVLHHRVVRPGQLAGEAELHPRCRRAVLLHDADAERRRSSRGVRADRLEPCAGAAAVPASVDAGRPPSAATR